jgi:peptide/nickel transport system ATP-binding protein
MNATHLLLEVERLEMVFARERSFLDVIRRKTGDVIRAVDTVNLRIAHGEAVGLVGESGSGKSTLARCLVGLYEPTSGRIAFEGLDISARRSVEERRRIQMVFQDPYSSLNPRMTVHATISEVLRVHHRVAPTRVDERCRELLDLVGLSPGFLQVYPRQLSGGQRQRISIARALALEPALLIADEPVASLDVSVQATILNLLSDLRRQLDLSLLFIAHDLNVVRHLCNRVAVMYLGRIVETADTEELFSNPRHPYTQALLAAIPRMIRGTGIHRSAILGDPPSPYRLPKGCRFNTRCPIAQELCTRLEPRLEEGPGRDHLAACHFAWQLVPSPGGNDA